MGSSATTFERYTPPATTNGNTRNNGNSNRQPDSTTNTSINERPNRHQNNTTHNNNRRSVEGNHNRQQNTRKEGATKDSSEDKKRRLILIGPIGSGKSATGNTILFQNFFFSKFSPERVTIKPAVRRQEKDIYNLNISVVDTPGIDVTHSDQWDVIRSVNEAIDLVRPYPHAFLLVLSMIRFPKLYVEIVRFIEDHFTEMINLTIVIFTGYDVFLANGGKLSNFKDELPRKFNIFLSKIKSRVLLFQNEFQKSWHVGYNSIDYGSQVDKLLQAVAKLPKPMEQFEKFPYVIPNMKETTSKAKKESTVKMNTKSVQGRKMGQKKLNRQANNPIPGTEFLHSYPTYLPL